VSASGTVSDTIENRVTFPEDHVSAFAKHEHVKEIEEDKKVSI
jgi:hypothetical protein